MSSHPARSRGALFIISGPSGVGKDTVLQRAMPGLSDIRKSISVTTRPPRAGEVDGDHYFFVPTETFLGMLERGELLEHAAVHGNLYGTPRDWVTQQLASGMDVILEIDVQGAVAVKSIFPQAILIFIAPPSWDELSRRLRDRNTEDEETIRRRLENARHELARVGQYEYLIINDYLNEAVRELSAVIIAEGCRPERYDLEKLLTEDCADA